LSDEGISFEEVAYREPQKARRPDLDPTLACIAYRVPAPDDLPIFLDRKPADAIERHALRDTSVELGGILLGKECIDEATGRPFVWITEALEAKHYENTQASFTYTHDSWGEITRERDEKYPDLDIVGWYHTHPDFGIFLSSHDLFIHHNFFDQPLQVAYVVDPIRQDRGFFFWRDGRMVQTGGFWLSAGRSERSALAKLANDLEGIPTADGGGGGSGLSPRLEAQLLAMLSRPQTVAVAADRGQSAAVFTLIGAMLGVLLFGAALWVQSLAREMKEQSDAIKSLVKAQKETVAEAKDQLASARSSAKEEALDSLIGDLKLDAASPKVAAKLSAVIGQRDEAIKAASRMRVEKDALADRLTTLDEKAREVEETADKAVKKAEATRDEALADVEKSRARIEKLNADLEIADQTAKEHGSGALLRRYNWAWYGAVIGWIGFLGCGLGWLATKMAGEDERRDDPPREDQPRPTQTVTIT
jgi:proteasome lid subunit RPN8/RPN11